MTRSFRKYQAVGMQQQMQQAGDGAPLSPEEAAADAAAKSSAEAAAKAAAEKQAALDAEAKKAAAEAEAKRAAEEASRTEHREIRDRGKQEGLLELAKQHGFASVEEMQAALQGAKKAPAAAPVATPPKPDAAADGKSAAETPEQRLARIEREKQELERKNKLSERKAKRARDEADAMRAEMELTIIAKDAGVKDVEVALYLLRKHLTGKDDAYLSTFEEKKWFEALKKERPALFGEVSVPANTGLSPQPSGTDGPRPPDPAAAAANAAEKKSFNAMTATREELDERVRSIGVSGGYRTSN